MPKRKKKSKEGKSWQIRKQILSKEDKKSEGKKVKKCITYQTSRAKKVKSNKLSVWFGEAAIGVSFPVCAHTPSKFNFVYVWVWVSAGFVWVFVRDFPPVGFIARYGGGIVRRKRISRPHQTHHHVCPGRRLVQHTHTHQHTIIVGRAEAESEYQQHSK